MAGFQDVGTIGDWTPARLSRYVTNLVNQRDQIAKSGVSSDAQFIHSALTFSAGDFNTADTIVTRPKTGILTINNAPMIMGSPYSTQQNFASPLSTGGTAGVGGPIGWYISSASSGNTWLLGTAGSAGVRMFYLGVTGDATDWRFGIDSDGHQHWGSGGAEDTDLFRGGAGNIQINTSLGVNTGNTIGAGTIVLSGRAYSGAPGTGGLWVDGTTASQFFGSIDSTHMGMYNGGWWLNLSNSGVFTIQGTIGYPTGLAVGGSVNQATSLTTAVTLNKICGQVNMFSTAWAAGLVVNFTVNNTFVAATDTIIINSSNNPMSSGLIPFIQGVFAGAFVVGVYNAGGLTGAGSLRLNFSVIKAANN